MAEELNGLLGANPTPPTPSPEIYTLYIKSNDGSITLFSYTFYSYDPIQPAPPKPSPSGHYYYQYKEKDGVKGLYGGYYDPLLCDLSEYAGLSYSPNQSVGEIALGTTLAEYYWTRNTDYGTPIPTNDVIVYVVESGGGGNTLDVTYGDTKIIDGEEVTPPVDVTYNGETIATLNAGDTATLDILGSDNKPKILSTPIVIGGKTISDVDALGRKWVLEHNLVVEVSGSPPVTGETWVINEQPEIFRLDAYAFYASFESNGEHFDYLTVGGERGGTQTPPGIYYWVLPPMETCAYDLTSWTDEAYRTIVLDEPATGDFLDWLEANAVKQ